MSSLGLASTTDDQHLGTIAARADSKYGALPDDLLSSGTQHITTRQQWEAKRSGICQLLLQYLGDFPTTTPALRPRELREEKLDGYTRRKVRYMTAPDEDIIAWLLIPDSDTSAPLPAVLAPHQTNEPASAEVIGIAGKPSMHYGLDLVRRGFVVLAPDSITAGERIYPGYEPFETAAFDRAQPQWSAIGKMIWDHQRGLDYLETLPFVDSSRIGVVGHSLGAYNAFFLAAFDDRVKIVVESCGYATIASDAGRERWARTKWFVHVPKLRPFVAPGSTLKAPFDFHEILALVAPRPLFQSVGLQDRIFESCDSVAQVHPILKGVYALYGAEDRLETYLFDGPHDFPPDAKERAYRFLDRHLRQKQ